MSNTLALATVSAVFEARITALLTSHGILGMAVTSTYPGEDADPGVYLKLYQLTPNAALRNAEEPVRRSDGSVAKRPRLALDLHYLVSFVGDAGSYDAERLAGAVLIDMHARPTLTAAEIADYLASLPSGHVLAGADLGDQLERVRFTPRALDLENLARLWGLLNQPFYGLSMGYDASVVLLDADVRPREALPVAERRLFAVPMATPHISAAHAEGETEPVARVGQTLVIEGVNLAAPNVAVRIAGQLVPMPDSAVGPNAVRLVLAPALGLRSGVVAVQVVHRVSVGTDAAPDLREGAESNAVAIALVPTVAPNAVVSLGGGRVAVRLSITPTPTLGQALSLELGAPTAVGASSTTWTLDGAVTVFTVDAAPSGPMLLRVRVDGAPSSLQRNLSGQFIGPMVTLP